jgi:hypothetical protein
MKWSVATRLGHALALALVAVVNHAQATAGSADRGASAPPQAHD